jgi:aminoglycoside phosphotransferase (APT) family kinase protein
VSRPATLSDPALPGLAAAMTRDALMELLARHLPECGRELEPLDARVVDVQYSAGASAHVLWKLNFRDRETGRSGRQLAFVQALKSGDTAPSPPTALIHRYAEMRAQKSAARTMPMRTPWLYVRDLHLALHAFPLDPALPTLMDAANPESVRQALHRMWGPRGARVRKVSIDTLSYTPGQRAALSYEVLSEDKDTAMPELRRLVGKLNARRTPARLFAGHWAVWRSTLGRASIAPPTGYVATMGLSLQEFVSGERLSDLAGPGAFLGQLRTAARAIASVHQEQLPLLSERGAEKEIGVVDRWIGVLSGLRPANAARLARLGKRLNEQLSERTHITGAIHADFHLANMLANDSDVTLIDWDQVAHGDPMVDVGRVLASLRVSSLRLNGQLDGLADAEDQFLRAYLSETKDDERRARLFEASSLLLAAAAPFRLQRDGWEESAELMLDEVERMLDLSMGGARAKTPEGECGVPYNQRADWALNRPYAQALLVPVVHAAFGDDIEIVDTQARLLEGNERRLRVRWRVKGFKGEERWTAGLDGFGFDGDSGRGRLRRLEIANEALAGNPEALQVPRALDHIGPLSLIVVAQPAGELLQKVLAQPDASDVVGRLARGLAGFHRLPLDFAKERSAALDLEALSRRADRLAADSHPLAKAARVLCDDLTARIAKHAERRAPTLRGLSVRNLKLDGSVVCATHIDDLLMAEPLLCAGDVSAQLHAMALRRRIPLELATAFDASYVSASGDDTRAFSDFAAAALLRYACRRAARRPDDPLVAQLVNAAREILAQSP